MRRISVFSVALLALSLLASAAQAESPMRALAKKHFDTGQSYYAIANYKDALAEFEKAYKLQPLPALLYNIGRCKEALGDLKGAIAAFRDYLAGEKEASDRALVETRITTLERRLAEASPPPPPTGEKRHDESDEVTSRPRWRSPTGWTLVGVGAATLVVGIVGGVMVQKRNDEYTEGADPTTGSKTYGELQETADSGRRWQAAEIGALVVGSVLAATGAGILIWDAASKRRREEETTLTLTPMLGTAGFGLAGRARF